MWHNRDMNAGDKRVIRVIMVGPGLDVRGGVSSVERLILAHAPEDVVFTHIATMRDGSRLLKAVVFVQALIFLAGALVGRRANLVHIHFSSRASTWRKLICATLCRWWRMPFILHAHGASYREFFGGLPSWHRRHIVQMLRTASAVICLGEGWKEFYNSIADIPEERLFVLSNPIALPEQIPDRSHHQQVLFLFLGRMEERKGPLRVVQALTRLPRQKLAKVRLVVAGDGDVQAVQQSVADLGLHEHVDVHTWLDERERNVLLQEGDVMVLPSLAEGMPMSVLEAMSWGIPVIASPVGGIPDLVKDGVNGFLVPPTDIDAIAQAMMRMIDDPNLRLRMGENARRSVEHLDIRHYWQHLRQVYESVLAERGT